MKGAQEVRDVSQARDRLEKIPDVRLRGGAPVDEQIDDGVLSRRAIRMFLSRCGDLRAPVEPVIVRRREGSRTGSRGSGRWRLLFHRSALS
jgi:hypothetical protein